MSGRVGEINGWRCDTCRRHTFAVHVDYGVTPMFLACRAECVEPDDAKCKGTGTSLMYPAAPPAHIVDAVEWEWYLPPEIEWASFPRVRAAHIEQGGLLIRPITNAGRELLAAIEDDQ